MGFSHILPIIFYPSLSLTVFKRTHLFDTTTLVVCIGVARLDSISPLESERNRVRSSSSKIPEKTWFSTRPWNLTANLWLPHQAWREANRCSKVPSMIFNEEFFCHFDILYLIHWAKRRQWADKLCHLSFVVILWIMLENRMDHTYENDRSC